MASKPEQSHHPECGNKDEHPPQQTLINIEDIPTKLIHGGTVNRKVLVRQGELGELATVNYAWLEPGISLEEHMHPNCTESYLFLEGVGTMIVAGNQYPVSHGDFVTVQPTEAHSLIAGQESQLTFFTWRAFER